MTRSEKRPSSLWMALGPAVSTVAIAITAIGGDAPGPWWLPGLLFVVGVASVGTIAVQWWRGRGRPQPPAKPSTSRWAAGPHEERWR